MRIEFNFQKLASLLLASCAVSGSLLATTTCALGQQPGSVQFAIPPVLGEVRTASGIEVADHNSSRNRPQSAVMLIAQPPANLSQPSVPALQGPGNLPSQAASSSDRAASSLADEPINGNDLNFGNDLNGDSPNQGLNRQADATPTSDSENSLTPIQNRELTTKVHVVDMSVAGLGTGIIPDAAFGNRPAEAAYGRLTIQKCVYWHPSSICHYPLRFEEAMLERHGHVRLGYLQPLVSGVRFFTTIPMLPYLNTLQPYNEPVYALGNYRPGSAAPLLRDTIPYDKHAAVVEALSVAGFFWAMPL